GDAADQSDDSPDDANGLLPGVDDDGCERGILGFEDDARPVAQEALDRGLALPALGVDEGDDDVVRLGAVLSPDQHEVAIATVRWAPAVRGPAAPEAVLAAPWERGGRQRQLALAVLFGEPRPTGRDAPENRDRAIRAGGGWLGRGERARRAPRARPALERTLALERTEMIERRAGRDAETLADLADGRRDGVPGREGADEAQPLALLVRELSHAGVPSFRR